MYKSVTADNWREKQKAFKTRKVVFLVLALLCTLVGPIFGGNIVGLIIGITGVTCLPMIFILYRNILTPNFNSAVAAAQREEAEQNRIRTIESGGFEFPVAEFYEKCVKEDYTEFEGAYNQKKIKMIADAILEANNIPAEHYHVYDSPEMLKKYLKQGRDMTLDEETRLAKEKAEAAKIPHDARLRDKEKQVIEFQESLKNAYGHEKRRLYIEPALKTVTDQINSFRKMKEFEGKMADYSRKIGNKNTERSWAVMGGIAEGLAGPAAGVAAAANTMRKNEEARQRKQDWYDIADQFERDSMRSRDWDRIFALEEKQREMQKELDQVKLRVVFDEIDRDTIAKSLEVLEEDVHARHNESPLEISVRIKNHFKPKNVPENASFMVDGTYVCEVYAGKMLVDSIILPLPKDGIPCGGEDVATGLCGKYATNQEPYTIKLKPNKLWVMEQ